MADINLTIIGMEQIGVSFGLALKRYMREHPDGHHFTITGVDADRLNLKEAEKLEAVDTTTANVAPACEGVHGVIMANHYAETRDIIQAIAQVLRPGCVVLDTAPLKGPSIRWADRYFPDHAYLVGITPVLSASAIYRPETGTEAARASLFDSGAIAICPSAQTVEDAVQFAVQFAALIGSQPFFMDPVEHDGIAATTEVLPVALSLALFRAAKNAPSWDDIRRMANTTFAVGTHHLAQYPVDLSALVKHDRESAVQAIGAVIEELRQIQALLHDDERYEGIEEVFKEANDDYLLWQVNREDFEWREKTESTMPDIKAGFMESVRALFLGRRRSEDED